MGMAVRACLPLPTTPSAAAGEAAKVKAKPASSGARVLVLGGTGRVGSSTATALSKLRPDLSILIGGRNREKGKSLASKLGKRSEFVQVDIHDAGMLEEALYGGDLVVHAAGPFQREDKCTVLEAAISTKIGRLCSNCICFSDSLGQHTARRLVSRRARGNSNQSKKVASGACNPRSNQLCDEQAFMDGGNWLELKFAEEFMCDNVMWAQIPVGQRNMQFFATRMLE